MNIAEIVNKNIDDALMWLFSVRESTEPYNPHPTKDKYLSALSNIRARIRTSNSDHKMDQFTQAYFRIINHGKAKGILAFYDHDGLVGELAQAQIYYITSRKNA